MNRTCQRGNHTTNKYIKHRTHSISKSKGSKPGDWCIYDEANFGRYEIGTTWKIT